VYLKANGSQSATGQRWRTELFGFNQNQNVRTNVNKTENTEFAETYFRTNTQQVQQVTLTRFAWGWEKD
jgi:hypothetical protein